MSTMDDFNRALFDRAEGKYKRAQFDDITTDEWCALIEWYSERVNDLENKFDQLVAECVCGASD